MQKLGMLGQKDPPARQPFVNCAISLCTSRWEAAMLRQTYLFAGVLPVWHPPAACQQLV